MRILQRLGLLQLFRSDHAELVFPLAILIALLALVLPEHMVRLARVPMRLLRAVSRNQLLAGFIVGLLALAAGATFLVTRGLPAPHVHDEFSYLLAADTFSHGRLTNPSHPLWIHFETFHVILQPTYASMYPPGQGLVLATGNLLFGDPWFGVWLSVVILGLVAWWALRGWFPPEWAFIGGLFSVTISCWSYWLHSYWGGAVAAIGGALVMGAWPRLERRPAVRESLLLGLGAAILANSRMYEGAVLTVIAGLALLHSAIVRPVAPVRVYLRRAVLPAGVLMLATFAWMMFYNWRLTGYPLLMPYVLNMRTYLHHGLFVWQADRPIPAYRHEVMRQLYSERYKVDRSSLLATWQQVLPSIQHYMASLMLLPLFGLPWLVQSRKIRGMLIATAGVAIAVSLSVWIRPHYLAPAMIGVVGLTVQALRYLSTVRIAKRRIGLFAAQSLIFLWLGAHWAGGVADLIAIQPPQDWAVMRARIQSRLEEDGMQHVVVVRYEAFHNAHLEWVYNGADLIDAPVLWVREMAPEQNRELIRYFKGRRIWLLEADRGRLTPYPE